MTETEIETINKHKKLCNEIESFFEELKTDLEQNKEDLKQVFKCKEKDNEEMLKSIMVELFDNSLMITYLKENKNGLYEKLLERLRAKNKKEKKELTATEEMQQIEKILNDKDLIKKLLTKEQIQEIYKRDEIDFITLTLTKEQLKIYKQLLNDNSYIILSTPFEVKDLKDINISKLKELLQKEKENTQIISKLLTDAETLQKQILSFSSKYAETDKETQEKNQDFIIQAFENTMKILEINANINSYFNIQDYPNLSQRDFIYRLNQERETLEEIENEINGNRTALTTYQPKAINTYKVFNDKVTNTLSELINNKEQVIIGTGGTKYKDLEIKALISNAEIKQNKVLSQWDKYILQAIYSVSINNPYFDINMIKRALNLKSYQKKTSINDEIKTSIEKMSITKISLDIAKELNETYKTPLNVEKIKALGIESYLLPLKKIYKKVGGAKQEMYCFIEKPIYFTYIEARNQILNLATEKLLIYGLTDTKENTMLKIYLKTRIDDMKYQKSKNKSNSYIDFILYDTIFKENDLLQDKELQQNEKAYNKKRDTYRKTIKDILQHYKDIKDIKDFEEIRENRKYTKLQIIL